MKVAINPVNEGGSTYRDVLEELNEFLNACNKQVFHLADEDRARFVVVRYFNDLQYLKRRFNADEAIAALIAKVVEQMASLYPFYITGSWEESHSSGQLTLGFSVAELGLLLHLFNTHKLIIHENKKEVIRFFADHFNTVRQEKISPNSLYGKYYKIDNSTFDSMKTKLIAMVNTINKMLRD
jgi:hypothetical protein